MTTRARSELSYLLKGNDLSICFLNKTFRTYMFIHLNHLNFALFSFNFASRLDKKYVSGPFKLRRGRRTPAKW